MRWGTSRLQRVPRHLGGADVKALRQILFRAPGEIAAASRPFRLRCREPCFLRRTLADADSSRSDAENWAKGIPVAVQYPTDGAILVATPSAILKNAPHPNAARLFMEFLLGPEFNKVLAQAYYETMRADVKPLPGAKSVAEIKVIRPSIEDATKGIPEVAEIWRDIFGQ